MNTTETKLHQIVAVREGKKTQATKAVTEVNKKFQKPTLFSGVQRTYRSTYEEEGAGSENLPEERQAVQFKVSDLLAEAEKNWTELWDVTATQDITNTKAVASVVVDGKVVLSQCPVTFLMFLEKQLDDLHTLVGNIPVLDTAETWDFDKTSDLMVTKSYLSNRTKKIPRTLVKYEATEKHPAQTEVYHEDVVVGEWHTKKFSSAVYVTEKNQMLDRVRKLIDAVKMARAKANDIPVVNQKVGKELFDFVFRGK